MAIRFEKTWDSHGNRITKEDKARAVIKSAAAALSSAKNDHMEIITWCNAINNESSASTAHFVAVEKNDHQVIGLVGRHTHLTMRVYAGEHPNNLYKGAVHLDIKMPDPLPGEVEKQQLIPVQISYPGHDKALVFHQIVNAAAVDSDT
jgi:hypothetical protein